MKTQKNGFTGTLLVLMIAIAIAVGLGELYKIFINALGAAPWVGVISAHAMLSVFLYILSSGVRDALSSSGIALRAWLPSVVVVVGAFALAFTSTQRGPSYAFTGSKEILYVVATLTVIPIFEEIVFRGGVTPILYRFAGPLWSIWFSALVFSIAHSHPTWTRVVELKIGFVLGPFLLGICCDMIVRRWGKLWPAIAFHSACNATVYIFSTFNPSWLSRLGGLYM